MRGGRRLVGRQDTQLLKQIGGEDVEANDAEARKRANVWRLVLLAKEETLVRHLCPECAMIAGGCIVRD